MPKPASKVKASTQKFTEIQSISGPIIVLEGGNACLLIEVTASNFALLSKKEQDAKMYAYASLLNSLSFPIEILIRNQRVDISSYIKTLEEQERQTQNPLLAQNIKLYKEFVHQMIKVNVVLNKEFYLIITYSTLEKGASGATAQVKKGDQKEAMVEEAKKSLLSKADSLLSQLRKLALSAKVMQEEELVKLIYNIYNYDTLEIAQVVGDLQSPLVKTQAS